MKKAVILILSICLAVFALGYLMITSEGIKENHPEDNVEFRYEKREF
jgi:hypothetical protein